VIICFVDISGIVDHHLLNLSFLISMLVKSAKFDKSTNKVTYIYFN